jgi:hypothetical protein
MNLPIGYHFLRELDFVVLLLFPVKLELVLILVILQILAKMVVVEQIEARLQIQVRMEVVEPIKAILQIQARKELK